MTTKEGKAFAVAQIEEFEKEMKRQGNATDKRITLWISIPWTGGSPRQYVNEARYYRSGNGKALEKLRGHITLFRKLLWVARDLAQEVDKINGRICLEWPTSCRYWHDPH
eukprot:3080929-Pyramimonas_sp.AAC.1